MQFQRARSTSMCLHASHVVHPHRGYFNARGVKFYVLKSVTPHLGLDHIPGSPPGRPRLPAVLHMHVLHRTP